MKLDLSTLSPKQLAAAKAMLDEADAKKGWPKFRGAALSAQTITESEWILAGPSDCSKSWACAWRMDTLMRETPGAQGAIVRKVRGDMGSTILKTFEKLAKLRGMPATIGGFHPDFYDYPNGSRLYVDGMDRKAKVLGAELDAIFVSQAEELDEAEWALLSSRCRGSKLKPTQLFAECNPAGPGHFIINRPTLRVLHATHRDNPDLYDDAGNLTPSGVVRIGKLDDLPGVLKPRLRYGLWVAAEGTVYPEFQRETHVIKYADQKPIPEGARRFRAIDFGMTHPFVCLFCWLDSDDTIYVYKQIYMTGRRLDQHIVDIKRISEGAEFEATVADSAMPDHIATLNRHSIHTVPAKKGAGSVIAGIQLVSKRLAPGKGGKPRLFVYEGSLDKRDESLAAAHKPTCLEDEFAMYAWKKNADGTKDEPEKRFDDACDAIRYCVLSVDKYESDEDESPRAEQPASYDTDRIFYGGARIFSSGPRIFGSQTGRR